MAEKTPDSDAELDEELESFDEKLGKEIKTSIELANKEMSAQIQKNKGQIEAPKRKIKLKDEFVRFVETTSAQARLLEYPSPQCLLDLTELVHTTNDAFQDGLWNSGYYAYFDKLKASIREDLAKKTSKKMSEQEVEKEAKAMLKKTTLEHDLRKFYERDFEKKATPDVFLNEALIAFNKAKISLVGLYERNGLLHGTDPIIEWFAHILYGAAEKFTVKDGDKEVSGAGLMPHAIDYAKTHATYGTKFLIESALDQIAKFPRATSRLVLSSELVEHGSTLSATPVAKQVYDKTIQTPETSKDLEAHKNDLLTTAKIMRKAIPVLTGLKENAHAGILHASAASLEELVETGSLLERNRRSQQVTELFEALATISGLPFDKTNAYNLQYLTGEKISLVLRAARLYHDKLQETTSTDAVAIGQPYFIDIPQGHRKLLGAGVKERKTELTQDLLANWITGCLSDEQFNLDTHYSDHPFADIARSLECFGIPDHHAKEFEHSMTEYFLRARDKTPEQALQQTLTALTLTPKDRLPKRLHHKNFDPARKTFASDIYDNLLKHCDGTEFASSLRLAMEELSGKTLPAFYATSYSKEKPKNWKHNPWISRGICEEIIVYGHDKEGNLVEADRIDFHNGDDALLKRYSEAHPEHDLYIGSNLGVAWILDIDMGWPKNPEWSRIELLYDVDDDKSAIENLVNRLQLALHETRHIGQTSSPLVWRYVASAVAEFFAEFTIEKYDAETLDKEASFTDFHLKDVGDTQSGTLGTKLTHPITLREHILKWFGIFNATALGLGKRAELLRQHGPYKGALLYDENGNPADPRQYAIPTSTQKESIIAESSLLDIINEIQLEDSKTTKLVQDVFTTIKELDTVKTESHKSRDKLQKLLYECRRAKTAFSTIIETDAEVSGLHCTKEVLLKAFEGNDAKQAEVEKAYNKKYDELVYAGEVGRKAGEILPAFKGKETSTECSDALKKIGVQYNRIYDSKQAMKVIPKNLKKLGFETLREAYANIAVLEQRRTAHNQQHPESQISEKNTLMPLNYARIDVQKRYRQNIPAFMSVIQKYGFEQAVEIFENAESVDDVIKYN